MRLYTKGPRLRVSQCGWCAANLGVLVYHYDGKQYCSKVCWEFDWPQLANEEEEVCPQLGLPFEPG
jgi:hypothetical protein